MDKTIKLIDNPFFQAFIGDRGLRIFRLPVNGRLGIPGLSRLVRNATGGDLLLNEAYGFLVKNDHVVKILTRDKISTNMMELHGYHAEQIKELINQE
jgi:hypothetical protein